MDVSDADLARFREILTQRLNELRDQAAHSADSRKPVELDQASVGRLSRMDAMQMQAMAQASDRLRGQEAERIKAALARLDEGEFGYCVACGDPIAAKRLEIDPTVPTCIRCASGTGR